MPFLKMPFLKMESPLSFQATSASTQQFYSYFDYYYYNQSVSPAASDSLLVKTRADLLSQTM